MTVIHHLVAFCICLLISAAMLGLGILIYKVLRWKPSNKADTALAELAEENNNNRGMG
jgi:hypothetical protein